MCKNEEHVVRCSHIRYLAITFRNDSASQQTNIEQVDFGMSTPQPLEGQPI